MTSTNATVSTGDVSGRYLSTGVTQGQCYKDCKALPGSRGCQYQQTSCFVGDCIGDCFGFTENVIRSDKFPDASCYMFDEPSPGEAGDNLKRYISKVTNNP